MNPTFEKNYCTYPGGIYFFVVFAVLLHILSIGFGISLRSAYILALYVLVL